MPGPARPMLRARLRLTSLAVLLAGSQAVLLGRRPRVASLAVLLASSQAVLLTRRPRAAAVARSATDAAAAEPLVATRSAGFDARLERTDTIPRVRIEMLPSKVDADDGHNMAAFIATVLDRDEDFIAFFDLREMQVGLRSKKTFAFGIDFMAQEPVWKSTSELGYPENYCKDLREPPRHRGDAVAETTSRRSRGAPEL